MFGETHLNSFSLFPDFPASIRSWLLSIEYFCIMVTEFTIPSQRTSSINFKYGVPYSSLYRIKEDKVGTELYRQLIDA